MSSDRSRLQSLVDALPDSEVQVAISFLAELGEQEILDAETAAKLDLARAEPGDDIPLDEVRRRLGRGSAPSFFDLPGGAIWPVLIASSRHGSDAALVRFAATGHGDVKSLKDRPGELRLRVGKWRVFFSFEPPDFIRVLGIDNRGEAY